MDPNQIRATVGSFWLNSLEAELLGCIALALAEILEEIQNVGSIADTVDQRLGHLSETGHVHETIGQP